MTDAELLDWIKSTNPEGYNALTASSSFGEKSDLNSLRYKRGHDLASSSIPAGRQMGSVYVADPLGGLIGGAKQAMGQGMMNGAMDKQQMLIDLLSKGRMALAQGGPNIPQAPGYDPLSSLMGR